MNKDHDDFTGIGDRFRSTLSFNAVLSLVAGIVGLPFCLTGSLPAVILGHIALRQIRSSKGRLTGAPLAYTGLILGYGQLLMLALFFGLLAIGLAVGPPETALAEALPAEASAEAVVAESGDAAAGPEITAESLADRAAAEIFKTLSALAAFRRDCGSFPADEMGLNALLEPGGVSGWKGPYLPGHPLDPWGRPMVYRLSDFGVEVFSTGPDGVESDDDIR